MLVWDLLQKAEEKTHLIKQDGLAGSNANSQKNCNFGGRRCLENIYVKQCLGGWEEEEKETRYGLFVKYLKKSSSSNNRIISPCKVLRTATPLKWWWENCILIMRYRNTHIILCPQKKCFETISNNNSNTTFRSKLRHIDSKNSYTRSSLSFTISMVSPCYKRPDWKCRKGAGIKMGLTNTRFARKALQRATVVLGCKWMKVFFLSFRTLKLTWIWGSRDGSPAFQVSCVEPDETREGQTDDDVKEVVSRAQPKGCICFLVK